MRAAEDIEKVSKNYLHSQIFRESERSGARLPRRYTWRPHFLCPTRRRFWQNRVGNSNSEGNYQDGYLFSNLLYVEAAPRGSDGENTSSRHVAKTLSFSNPSIEEARTSSKYQRRGVDRERVYLPTTKTRELSRESIGAPGRLPTYQVSVSAILLYFQLAFRIKI